MNELVLNGITVEKRGLGTRFTYDYSFVPALDEYIKGDPLFVEFPGDLESIPDSIKVIPFVGIMLSATMLLDTRIHVPVLDKEFYNNIPKLASVYDSMYPNSNLCFSVIADSVEDRPYEASGCALMFTGGVDATSALIELLDKKPLVLNIWGGDLRLTDNDSHLELESYLNKITEFFSLNYSFVKTNGRETFKENELGDLTTKHVGRKMNEYGWWATIAHSISMLTSVAPLMYAQKIATVYIGSTHANYESSYDANNQKVLDAISFSSGVFSIADGDLVRNQKVTKIVQFKKQTDAPIQLKVCWQRTAGKNCSSCEKCYRTILNILSNHGDPNELGFNVDSHTYKRINEYLNTHHVGEAFWKPIQDTFIAEKEFWANDPDISWFLTKKINSPKTFFARAKRKIKKLIHA